MLRVNRRESEGACQCVRLCESVNESSVELGVNSFLEIFDELDVICKTRLLYVPSVISTLSTSGNADDI